MTKIYSIYKATNLINNKIYIGFDSNWPKRKHNHSKDSFNKKRKQYWYKFHKTIREFGFNNFEWEIIYQSLEGAHTLKIMEPYFIKQYDSFNNGYNMTKGGEGNLGLKHSKEQKYKWSLERKGENNPIFGLIGINNPNYGKKMHSNEHKIYISNLMIGNNYGIKQGKGEQNKKSKPYKFYKGLNEINIKGLREFCRENNLDQGAMTRVNSGKQIIHKGYSKNPIGG